MFCICELESLSQKLQWDYNFVLWCFRTWQRAGWFYEQFRGKRASPKKYHHRKFFFNHVEQVKEHLEQKHLDKSNWVYKVVSEDHLEEIRKQAREEFKILQCKKLRIIAFFPDGWIMRKEKILLLLQMSKWRFRQMWIWARQNHQKRGCQFWGW